MIKVNAGYGSMIVEDATGARLGCFKIQSDVWVGTHLTVQEGGYGDSACQSGAKVAGIFTVPTGLTTVNY